MIATLILACVLAADAQQATPRPDGLPPADRPQASEPQAIEQPVGKPATAGASNRPNVVVIIADDLGFSDLGCYGGEIATPSLDRLAAGGLRYRAFYNTARCWPTRSALLTGHYAQSIRRDQIDGLPRRVASGGRGKRPAWAPLIAEPLRAAGYRTYHSGKWHVDGMPGEGGFDRSYYLKDQSRFFSPTTHWLDDEKLPPVPQPASPEMERTGYYGTDAVGEYAVGFLDEHSRLHAGRPFFLYLAFAAPHFPLHARPQDIARYDGRYDAGWDAVRDARFRRQQEIGLGLSPLSPPLRNVGSPYGFVDQIALFGPGELDRVVPWSELNTVQREFQATKMAIHAAMIDRMDRQIGRVVAQLEATDALDDTLLLFLSDNGASAELMVRGDGHDPKAPPGSSQTYLCLGPGWSTTANTPFAYHKTWTHEGGIATPLVVHWPDRIAASDRGGWRDQVGHVIDLWPTIAEATGFGDPSDAADPPRPGRSLLPTLVDDIVEPRRLWWSHEENRAYRDGDWKLVSARADRSETGTGDWELYDLSIDRTETNDLATEQPERVEQMAAAWEALEERHREMAMSDLGK